MTQPTTPSDRTCRTCHHWDHDPDNILTGNYGQCTRTPCTGDIGYSTYSDDAWNKNIATAGDDAWMADQHPGATAFTSDASGYHSALWTHPTHACTMWEAD